jgi:hypothetical protein
MNRYRCRTYIDEGRTKEWPTSFVTCPRVGDYVASVSGFKLKVASITHCAERDKLSGVVVSYIEVELNR